MPEHRDIRVDAYLKIALCHLKLGNANEAKSWLLRVREKDMLSEHIRRNHAELRALSYDLNDELEAETVVRELEKTQVRDKSNRRVLLALRDRHEAAGNLDQARVIGKQAGRRRRSARKRNRPRPTWRCSSSGSRTRHWGAGDTKSTRKALKGRPGDVRAALLIGDLALDDGNVPAGAEGVGPGGQPAGVRSHRRAPGRKASSAATRSASCCSNTSPTRAR